MLKYFLSLILLLNGLGSISAQSAVKYSYNFNSTQNKQNIFTSDTLKILAVLADFQIDRDEATFGNGKFGSIYSKDYGTTILDPLPHDKSYFEKHLDFVKNYYQKVSKNKLVIKFTVLPGITTVSKTMRNYSPAFNSTSFLRLGDFAKEVWEKTSLSNPNFDFSRFNLFIIFHAGAGKEISLPGSLGIEKDLPSLFLSKISLKEIYGQNFSGFTLSNSTFKITNTMIMPETENREAENILGVSLVQLSINGLLAANVGSFIGLPDLFNTVTGQSAIGRFGLMDGESFFSFKGLFPPEPSAWEKIKLGWAKSVDLIPGDYDINLISNLAASLSDTVILKVPISPKEYYLIENRNRDVNKDGAVVTYIVGGDTLQKTFLNDSNSFSNISSDSLQGVIIDVDEFDWALPGNGILIWHVDENIIDSKIDSNLINADKNNKGIFLEEADGIFDIGERFVTILGDVIIGQGTEDDFWFSNNTSKFYTNKFAPDTRPSSNSNKGANSLITISNFSNISNNMSFHISYGDSVIVPMAYKKLNLSSGKKHLTVLQNNANVSFSVVSDSNMYLLDEKGNTIKTFPGFSSFKTANVKLNNTSYIIGGYKNKLNIYMSDEQNNFLGNVSLQTDITSTPIIRKNVSDEYEILLSTSNNFIYKYSLGNLPSTLPMLKDSLSVGNPIIFIASSQDYIAFIGILTTESPVPIYKFGDSNGNTFSFFDDAPTSLVMTKNNKGEYISIVSTKTKIFVFNNGKLKDKIEYAYNNSKQFNNILSLTTGFNNNGENYIIYTFQNKIIAKSINGTNAENFPINDSKGIGFNGNVISADFVGDEKPEIISVTKDGRIFAVNSNNANVVNGFPIKIGNYSSSTLSYFSYNNKGFLTVIDDDNYFYSWSIASSSGKNIWTEENGNPFNNNFIPAAKATNIINLFLPKERSYNYPNPVYGNSTKIRYFVSEDSKINIKIFDISGAFVAELNSTAQGGFDSETVWDVSNIQSGVYLARIEAVGSSGKTETNIIKIAVVK